MAALIKFLSNLFSSSLKWFFNTIVIKFLIFTVIFIAVTEVVPLLIEVFIPSSDFSSSAGNIASEVAYFLHPFALDKGIPMILSAYMTRFTIRRIPFVG